MINRLNPIKFQEPNSKPKAKQNSDLDKFFTDKKRLTGYFNMRFKKIDPDDDKFGNHLPIILVYLTIFLIIWLENQNPFEDDVSEATTNPKQKTAKVAPAPKKEVTEKKLDAIESIFVVDQK